MSKLLKRLKESNEHFSVRREGMLDELAAVMFVYEARLTQAAGMLTDRLRVGI